MDCAKVEQDVSERFLERSKVIPSSGKPLDEANLRDWIRNSDSKNVSGYVMPVIAPLDFIFLLSFGCLLGLVSATFAGQVKGLAIIPIWVWWVFPILYMLTDVAEDSMIAAILSKPELLGSKNLAS